MGPHMSLHPDLPPTQTPAMNTKFTLTCLAVLYGGFAWVLDEQRDSVMPPYVSASVEPPAAPSVAGKNSQ